MINTTNSRRIARRAQRSAGSRFLGLWCVVGLVGASLTSSDAQTPPADLVIFDDSLQSGFEDWSWAETRVASEGPTASGTTSLFADLGPWGGLSLGNSRSVPAPSGGTLEFSVHGGDNDSVRLMVVLMGEDFAPVAPGVEINAPGAQWTRFEIPLSDLGAPSTLGGLWWQEAVGADPSPVFVDDVSIVSPAGAPSPQPVPAPQPDPEPQPDPAPAGRWAFEETFDGTPSSPSQDLLPREFEYVVTHRSHPGEHFDQAYTPFLADHDHHCAGPDPAVNPLPQHHVETRQDTNGSNPDSSFFICRDHMMSSMGEVGGYSVSSFWPRQEFNFSDGGVLEFDVNINDGYGVRSWWEVMIVPRDQLRVGAGPVDSPISETYPDDRIVLDFRRNVRTIKVGSGSTDPDGWQAKSTQWGMWDFAWWRDLHPGDPANNDARIRRTMRVELQDDRIVWGIETADGTFDQWAVDVPGGLPFDQGLVVFKTHAYTPIKDGNVATYTFHWDNIRFDGPKVGFYDVHEADDVVYLQRNGHRSVGESQTVSIDLPATLGRNPVLFGQVHQPKRGQVLLSINGGPNMAVSPSEYELNGCASVDWQSFRLELDAAQLRPGDNTLTWTIGPRPGCVTGDFMWDGFSVKYLHLQTDARR